MRDTLQRHHPHGIDELVFGRAGLNLTGHQLRRHFGGFFGFRGPPGRFIQKELRVYHKAITLASDTPRKRF